MLLLSLRCRYYFVSVVIVIIISVVVVIIIISINILPSVVPGAGCLEGLATRDGRSPFRFQAVSAFSSSPSVLG